MISGPSCRPARPSHLWSETKRTLSREVRCNPDAAGAGDAPADADVGAAVHLAHDPFEDAGAEVGAAFVAEQEPAGKLSSTLLLRRPGTESHRNKIYKAFREVRRVIRTITLLRFISEPKLREEITAATNKAEAYNGFSAWLMFGNEVITRNDPAGQEKILKFNSGV
jgi:hypothetical protein